MYYNEHVSHILKCIMHYKKFLDIHNVYHNFFRKWSATTVWWIPSGVCQHSNMWHRSILLGQKDLYCHLQRWYHFSFFRRKGTVFVVTLPSNPANCHPCTHSLAILIRYHLYHSHQLLCHDQTRIRVSSFKFNKI